MLSDLLMVWHLLTRCDIRMVLGFYSFPIYAFTKFRKSCKTLTICLYFDLINISFLLMLVCEDLISLCFGINSIPELF